ncbi:MAG TPA: isocitrate/isopropylmalate family dehydrogenase [Myxococcales bacterium]|jgi:3-isopropylmalate dehydrogenase|nr:isocitrate/isopropylmalate family dehydrogenase [Myxococcales bacterium]
MPQRIAVIPGDGIGPEVARIGVRILESLQLPLQFDWFDFGADRYLRDRTILPAGFMDTLRKDYDAIYFGAVGDPRVPGNEHAKGILLAMRFELDLYINLRPCVLMDDRLSPLKGKGRSHLRFTVFRENTEGLYTGTGGVFKKGTPDEIATETEINTRKGVERIVEAAFAFAGQHGLTRVCMADKANVLLHGHGLWRRVFAEAGKRHPKVEAKAMYVDALAMDLIRQPEAYEVIVTNNLFGDILTDLGAALTGGLGIAASGNIHPGKVSLFEPVHGSAPDIAGQGKANPLAMALTGAMMLEHLGHPREAQIITHAVEEQVREGAHTPDLIGLLGGPASSTSEVGDELFARVQRAAQSRL